MHLLISNDDGFHAPGIKILAERMAQIAKITVVAPSSNRSGASNSLTLDGPIKVSEMAPGQYKLSGTPTDCVHIALTGMLDKDPDMVVSGINAGANLGDDVLYSGTVAAAMEGRFLGLPAVAISLVWDQGEWNYSAAAEAAALIVQKLRTDPLPADTILNVNVPNLAWKDIKGFEVARLGHRHRAEAAVPMRDPRGRLHYWIGGPGEEEDSGPGTDFDAVKRGFVSITPIHIDLTRYQALEQVSSWVGSLLDPDKQES